MRGKRQGKSCSITYSLQHDFSLQLSGYTSWMREVRAVTQEPRGRY